MDKYVRPTLEEQLRVEEAIIVLLIVWIKSKKLLSTDEYYVLPWFIAPYE